MHVALTVRAREFFAVYCAISFGICSSARAFAAEIGTPGRIGAEFRVSEQARGSQSAVSLVTVIPGQVVAAWSGHADEDWDSPRVIWAGVLDYSGRVSGDIRIRPHRKWYSSYPAIDGDATHGLMVLWTDFNAADGSKEGVLGRLVDLGLTPASSTFQVNTVTVGRQIAPDVAMNTTGAYLAVWHDYANFEKSAAKARFFHPSGSPQSDEITLASGPGTATLPPRVAALDERYVVTWAAGDGEKGFDVYFRIFNEDGSEAVTARAHAPTAGFETYPDVAVCRDGRFIIVWGSASRRTEPDGGIYGQWFDSTGTRLGEQLHINTYTNGLQNMPVVATTPNCQAIVIWQSYGQDGDQEGVYGRIWDPAGSDASPEFRINESTKGPQGWSAYRETAVVADTDGSFFAAWTSIPNYSNTLADDPDVMGQWFCWLTDSADRVCGNATCVGDPIEAETRESIKSSDALAVLRSAVGAEHCAPCRCDADDSGATTAVDALAVLRAALLLPSALSCPSCPA